MKSKRKFTVLHLINEGRIGGREKQLLVMLEQNRKYAMKQEVVFENGIGEFYNRIKHIENVTVHVAPKKYIRQFFFVWSKCRRADLIILHSPSFCFMIPLIFCRQDVIYRLSGTVVTLVKGLYQEKNKGFSISKSPSIQEKTGKHQQRRKYFKKYRQRLQRLVRIVLFLYTVRYRSKLVWVLSQYSKTIAQNYYGISPSKVTTFGLALDFVSEQKRFDQAPCKIDHSEIFNIVYIGRYISSKRIERLLALADAVRDKKVRFFIVGYGSEEKYLKKVAQDLALDNVYFMPKASNPYSFLKKADLFVYPSEHDAFGNSVVEAMFAGVPVVIFPQCGASEIIETGKNGFVVRSVEELIHVVENFLGKEEELHWVGQNGRQTVISKLNADYVFSRFFLSVTLDSSLDKQKKTVDL